MTSIFWSTGYLMRDAGDGGNATGGPPTSAPPSTSQWTSAFESADGVIEPKTAAPEAGRAFWEHTVAEETDDGVWTTHADELLKRGILLPDPARLSDAEISPLLQRIAATLAAMQVYLRHTDHLSDRDLYVQLTTETLRESRLIGGARPPACACILDLVGSQCGREAYLWLKHYATDTQREKWSTDNPGYVMPAREPAPCCRDAALPGPR